MLAPDHINNNTNKIERRRLFFRKKKELNTFDSEIVVKNVPNFFLSFLFYLPLSRNDRLTILQSSAG